MRTVRARRFWTAALLAGSLTSTGAVATEPDAASKLAHAFGAAFDLLPPVAKFDAGSCQNYAGQASKIGQLRDLQISRDQALALLKVPVRPSPTQVDQSIAEALGIIYLAIVDFVYDSTRPPPDLSAAVVNSACLIEVGRFIRGTSWH